MLAAWVNLLAQTDAPKPQGTGWDTFMFLVMPLMLFVVFIVLPMRRDSRVRRDMLSNMKKGDRVLVNGFLIGTVVQIIKAEKAEDELLLKVDDNSGLKLRVLRGSVTRILKSEEAKEGS